MKTILSLIIAVSFLACGTPKEKNEIENQFGEKIDTSNSILVSDLKDKMAGKSEMPITLKGKITDVCQKEGCWLNMENTGGSPMLVRMKDHAFKVPKDIAGRTIYIQGTAVMDTTSVGQLRDYAQDAGKTDAEVQAITQPETELIVEAKGVVLMKPDGIQK